MRPGALIACALAAGVVGCGLKTSLELPEKSGDVVIRSPQQGATPAAATPAEGPTPEPATEPPATAAKPESTVKDAPKPSKLERLPPPPLPSGNAGTSRGG